MSMGSGGMGGMGSHGNSTKHACKISMLWNWNTLDTCFIARSWHNNTRGKFAGSCIGCFALVVAAQWLNRVGRQFDLEAIKREKWKIYAQRANGGYIAKEEETESEEALELFQLSQETSWKTTGIALWKTLSHTWYLRSFRPNLVQEEGINPDRLISFGGSYVIYPSFPTHITRVAIFVLQWGLSYIIMLLFMYYNGYIIISCIIGAVVGRLLFNYEPLAEVSGSLIPHTNVVHDKEVNDRKCCM